MEQPIMVGCDLHDQSILLRIGRGREAARTLSVRNSVAGRLKMIEALQVEAAASGARIIFAYEASGQGFGLYDELTAAGIEAHVLAPTRMVRSPREARNKTDEKDAEQILQLLRGHVLAGNPLPDVWIPDATTRDDRDIVRTRIDVGTKIVRLKSQVKCLLKRERLVRPEGAGQGWTILFYRWLHELTEDERALPGMREALASLLRQLMFHKEEMARLDEALTRLVASPRYAKPVAALVRLRGVAVLTALIFVTEMGDPTRFANRRQVGAYLGLVPAAFESGQRNDCKGHITRQGPSRVRRALCQASWSRVREDDEQREAMSDAKAYARIVAKNPKHKKIAVVAVMRRLAVQMWHKAHDAWPPEVPAAAPMPPMAASA